MLYRLLHNVHTRILSFVLVVVFICALFGTLFTMLVHTHGNTLSEHCMFLTDKQALCSMDIQEHIEAWQATFAFVVPILFGLFLAVGGSYFIAKKSRVFFLKYLRLAQWYCTIHIKLVQERCYSWFYRPLQSLFSRGILHPQLYG